MQYELSMPRITRDEFLIEILDFILNKAEESELDAIHNAMLRRGRRQGVADLDFKSMAGQMVDQFQIEMPDFHGMTREMVRSIILQHEPGIQAAELDALLQHYAPDRPADQATQARGNPNIPPEVMQEMLRQFISYSLGRMPESEDRALRAEMPNWPETYWEQFDSATQTWIRELINESTRSGGSQ